MRLGQVMGGNKFVFEDRGGVWQKTGHDRARCIFGKKGEYGMEMTVSPDAFVFGLFDRPQWNPRNQPPLPAPKPVVKPASVQSTVMVTGGNGMGMKVIIGDVDNEDVLMEIADASSAMVSALSSIQIIRMKLPRKRIPREYAILDTAVDVTGNTLYVMVRPDKPVGGKDDSKEDDEIDEEKSVEKVKDKILECGCSERNNCDCTENYGSGESSIKPVEKIEEKKVEDKKDESDSGAVQVVATIEVSVEGQRVGDGVGEVGGEVSKVQQADGGSAGTSV